MRELTVQEEHALSGCRLLALLIASAGAMCVLEMIQRTSRWPRADGKFARIGAIVFAAWSWSRIMLGEIIIYFGLPKMLTFGFQVGKVLPSTCEASMAIEGIDGTPCSLQRFSEWFKLAASGDGSLHLDLFEHSWMTTMLDFGSIVLIYVMFYLVVRYMEVHEKEGRAGQQMLALKHGRTEKDLEHGVYG